MAFAETFIGNHQVVTVLDRQLNTGTTAGAYFFVGPTHVGKSTLAEAVAREWCGTTAQQDGRINILAGDADGGSIGIEQVRDLRTQLRLQSSTGNRMIIIKDVLSLTEPAANGLLKLIEEPPTKTLFILTGESVGDVPLTISSRCQILYLQPVPIEELKTITRPRAISPSVFHEMVSASSGRPGTLVSWLDQPETFTEYKCLVKDLTQALSEPSVRLQPLSSTEARQSVFQALETIIHGWIHHTYRVSRLNPAFKRPALSPRQLTALGSNLFQLKRDIRANVNPQAAFENFIISSIV